MKKPCNLAVSLNRWFPMLVAEVFSKTQWNISRLFSTKNRIALTFESKDVFERGVRTSEHGVELSLR